MCVFRGGVGGGGGGGGGSPGAHIKHPSVWIQS